MTRILIVFFATLLVLTNAISTENMVYLGVGYSIMSDDDATVFSHREGIDDFENMQIPLAAEIAYYIGITDQFGIGPVISNRLNISKYDYTTSARISQIGGVMASHTLIGVSGAYYLSDDFGDGFFGRVDFGLGLANYFLLDGNNIQNIPIGASPVQNGPVVEPYNRLTDDVSDIGLGLSIGTGYSFAVDSDSAFDIQLLYSIFPIAIKEQLWYHPDMMWPDNNQNLTDGASYITLLVGFRF